MHNWSTDVKKLSQSPEKYKVWQMEQLINFGLGDQKLRRSDLEKYLEELVVDPQKKKYLEYLLSFHE